MKQSVGIVIHPVLLNFFTGKYNYSQSYICEQIFIKFIDIVNYGLDHINKLDISDLIKPTKYTKTIYYNATYSMFFYNFFLFFKDKINRSDIQRNMINRSLGDLKMALNSIKKDKKTTSVHIDMSVVEDIDDLIKQGFFFSRTEFARFSFLYAYINNVHID